MSLPKQVEDQLNAVNAHYANNGAEPQVDDTPSADPVVIDPPVDPNAGTVTDGATVSPAPVPAPVQPTIANDAAVEELKRMHGAEVARLSQIASTQASRIQSLEQVIASMQQAAQAKPAELAQPASLITDEDKSIYGESIDVMRRVCREELGALSNKVESLFQMVTQLNTSVVPRVDQMARTQAQSAEAMFWQRLAQLVPDWEQINTNPQFITWLSETDPFTNKTRQSLLELAQARLDADHVARIFKLWPGNVTDHAGGKAQAKVSELQAQLAPGRGRGTTPPSDLAPKTYTRADVVKFYSDVNRGLYKGRDDERLRMEREIFAASKENRITG